MSNEQQKGSGFVPIGNIAGVVALPDGRALPKAAPKARHHFTRLDQINQLVRAGEADPDAGFMVRWLMLCTLPRSNPGIREKYVRHNGPLTLVMTAGHPHKLPFGNIPRLLAAWVCTEAVKTQSRELVLGHSLAEFMRKLDIDTQSGGRGGVRTRLQNQMQRFFNAQVRVVYQDEHSEQFMSSAIADRGEFWWSERKPDEPVLWESKIRLGEDFFREIIAHPVPLDMNTLKSLSRSPLGLDLYVWLVYRTFNLDTPKRLSWPVLYRQFGVNPTKASDRRTVDSFRTDCIRELKKIKTAWPGLEYRIERGRRHEQTGALVLHPSNPKIVAIERSLL